MSVKIAVLAPIPSARDRIATVEKRGLRRRPRRAKRRSARAVVIPCFDEIGGGTVYSGPQCRPSGSWPTTSSCRGQPNVDQLRAILSYSRNGLDLKSTRSGTTVVPTFNSVRTESEATMNQSERERVVSLCRQLLEAWNKRDADAFAATFAEDGSSVGFDGSVMNGRTEIASTLRGIFDNHPTAAYVAKVREVRALGPGVVLIRSVVGMVPPGKDELNPAVNAVQSLVVVEKDAGLKIALLHNTPAAFHGRPDLARQLTRELTDALHTGHTVTTAR